MFIEEQIDVFNTLPQATASHVRDLVTETPTTAHPTPIETIIAVGALYTPEQGFSPFDNTYLKHALLCARELGLPATKQTQVGIVNLQDGHDYLAPHPLSADMVVLCFIPKEGKTAEEAPHPSLLISPFGNGKHIWMDRIAQRLPQIVVSIENRTHKRELTAWDIIPPEYNYGPAFQATIQDPRSKAQWEITAHTILRRDVSEQMPRHISVIRDKYQPKKYFAEPVC